jgi:inorganic pyrophosphatase
LSDALANCLKRHDCPSTNVPRLATENGNHSYAHVKRIDDLGKRFERELEEFFVNYRLSGEQYRILAGRQPAAAA